MKKTSLLVLIIATFMTTASAHADDSALALIKKAGVLKIGTTGDYKPFSYKSPNGELTGADIYGTGTCGISEC